MKLRNIILTVVLLSFFGCSSIYTSSNDSTGTNLKITIKDGKFKNLGHWVGIGSIQKKTISLKEREAVASQAKTNMIKAATDGNAYQVGKPQIFINTKVEFLENRARIICTVSADLIEFL